QPWTIEGLRSTGQAEWLEDPPVYSDYVFISWIETGCMWWVPGADPGYIGSKLGITPSWWLDAQSIAAFMENLHRVGTDKPMVTSKEMPR
ncbi:MAG TPA: hypothetical protein VFB99_08090, partial [Vicinamibacterales bacterium]|nr:hypothetical protein [Vicinamibacterales bacterium]